MRYASCVAKLFELHKAEALDDVVQDIVHLRPVELCDSPGGIVEDIRRMDNVFDGIALVIPNRAIAHDIVEVTRSGIAICNLGEWNAVNGDLRTRRNTAVLLGKAICDRRRIRARSDREGRTLEVRVRLKGWQDIYFCEDHARACRVLHPLCRVAGTAARERELRRVVEIERIALADERRERGACRGRCLEVPCNAVVVGCRAILGYECIVALAYEYDVVARTAAGLIPDSRTGERLREGERPTIGECERDARRTVCRHDLIPIIARIIHHGCGR